METLFRNRLTAYITVFLISLVSCITVSAGHLLSPDGELMYRTTEAIALRGELHVVPIEYDDPQTRALIPPEATFATVLGRNGDFYVQYLPLQSVLSVPLVWLGSVTQGLFADAFYPTVAGMPTLPNQSPEGAWRRAVTVTLFNPIVTALTAIFLMRLVAFATGCRRETAAGVALLYVLGTVALPHSRSYFTEPLAGLLALVSLDAMLRWHRTPFTPDTLRFRWRQGTVMGVALALSIWTRMDSPLIAFGMGLTMVGLGELKRRGDSLKGKVISPFPFADYAIPGAIIISSFALLIFFNQWRFGDNATLLGGGYADQSEGVKLSTPFLVGLHGLVASPGKGLFFFSPTLVIAVVGWIKATPELKRVGVIAALSYLPFTIVMIKWQNWDGGFCWGPRHIVQLHAPLMLGAVMVVQAFQNFGSRLLIYIVGTVGLAVNLYGSLQNPLDFYLELYRTPQDGEYYTVSYRPELAMKTQQLVMMQAIDPETGRPYPFLPNQLPAPMVDSLYIPQHSQWTGNAVLWNLGYCDWWLLCRLRPQPSDVP